MNKIEKLIYERELLTDLKERLESTGRLETFISYVMAQGAEKQIQLETLLTQEKDSLSNIAQKIEYLKIEYKVYKKLYTHILLKKLSGESYDETHIIEIISDALEEIYEIIMED